MINYWLQPRCIICHAEAANFFCNDCESLMLPHHCKCCTRRVAGKVNVCSQCQKSSILDALFVERLFAGNNRKIVLAAKFHKNPAAIHILQRWIGSQDIRVPINTVVIPLPISFWRLLQRGFNQTEFLASAVAKRLNLTVDKRLLLRHHRDAQSTIKGTLARKENIKNVFYLTAPPPKSVLLVDDVVTSGATLHEAAKLLRLAGCEFVAAAAVTAT